MIDVFKQLALFGFSTTLVVACAMAVDEPLFSCEKDADCPSGYSCNPVDSWDNICEPPECKSDSDCDADQYCDDDFETCREYCDDSWDCSLDEICNSLTRHCVPEDE